MYDEVVRILEKKLKLILELEETYYKIELENSRLHIRYAPILTEEPLFELSTKFDLLDDATQDDLSELMEDYYFANNTSQNKSENQYYGKVIPENNLQEVIQILGLNDVVDTTHKRDLFNQLFDLYNETYETLNSIFYEGETEEQYFGNTYYPKLQTASFSYCIDDDNIYLMNYTKGLIPDIYAIQFDKRIQKIIDQTCVPASDLEFYTTS